MFAYHIGDLDEFYFEHCQWGVRYGYLPRIEEAILIYNGGILPTVLAFGLTDQFNSLLGEMVEILPERFYCHFTGQAEYVLSSQYNVTPLGEHLKMKLSTFIPYISKEHSTNIRRLDASDVVTLRSFYDSSYPGHYFHERMLATGKYLGCFVGDDLKAVAGVHVYSSVYKIAVLGNVATHPDFRNRGFSSYVTARLVEELVGEDLLVCLNVQKDNSAAVRLYEKLGFERVHEYKEALFETGQGR